VNRRALRRRTDVVAIAGAASIGLLLAYYVLLTRATTLERLVSASSASPVYLAALAVLVLVTTVLLGANFAIFVLLTRARLATSGQTGSVVAGIVGAFGVGCPACGAYLLSLLGVSAGLAVLPFGGLEIWALASLLMAATLARSWRTLGAACRDDEAACPSLPAVSHRLTVVAQAAIGILSATLFVAVATYG
jgi:hypothetical protein